MHDHKTRREKSIIRILIIFIIILNLNTLSVFANENKISMVTFKAYPEDNFNSNIMLNFYRESININFSLTKNNNYEYTIPMEYGKYELDFVSIYDNSENSYKNSLPEFLYINEDYQLIEFNISSYIESSTTKKKNNNHYEKNVQVSEIIGIGFGIFMVMKFLKDIKVRFYE